MVAIIYSRDNRRNTKKSFLERLAKFGRYAFGSRNGANPTNQVANLLDLAGIIRRRVDAT